MPVGQPLSFGHPGAGQKVSAPPAPPHWEFVREEIVALGRRRSIGCACG